MKSAWVSYFAGVHDERLPRALGVVIPSKFVRVRNVRRRKSDVSFTYVEKLGGIVDFDCGGV